jgi:hypothetical protein
MVVSLAGTVVAYRLLRDEGRTLGWEVPLFVTSAAARRHGDPRLPAPRGFPA